MASTLPLVPDCGIDTLPGRRDAATPRIFLQATVQYNNQTEDVGSNNRFGWLNTADTGLYVVYNDIQHLGAFDRTGVESGPKSRQLIVKYTRQFDIGW